MTCTRYENQLALYVEHDLPQGEIGALEAHLRDCISCRGFLSDLGSSQGLVRDLAAESMSAEALAIIRTRAISAFEQQAARPRAAWGWGVAAALAAVGVLSWLTMRPLITVARRQVEALSSPSPAPNPVPNPAPELAAVERGESHPALTRSKAGGKRPVGSDSRQPSTVASLSVEDADQLARAVVAVSRIQRLTDPDPTTERTPMAPPGLLIRLATPDPEIVIYWRLDPNGGQ
jgi:hypothetical protein